MIMTNHPVEILGVPVGSFTQMTLLARLRQLLETPGCAYTFGVNAHCLNLARQHPDFLRQLQEADCVYADGASLLLAARVLGQHLPEKITTTDLWPPLCDLAVGRNLRFFLFGGEPGLAERARRQALQQHPNLNIVGVHDGYSDIFGSGTVEAINAVRPDIVWVGLGDPLQGRWAWEMRSRLQASLMITCGGMFKIVAGELQRVSYSWQQRGGEWLFRLWQEPQTWRRYLLGLPLFGFRVLGQRLEQHLSRRRQAQKLL